MASNNIYPLPKAGEKWSLKRDATRVCLVTSVDIESATEKRGYVWINAFWMKRGYTGKSLDTFLKQYERKLS